MAQYMAQYTDQVEEQEDEPKRGQTDPLSMAVRTQVFGHNDGILGTPLIQTFVDGGVFGIGPEEYGAFGTKGALVSVSFHELADYIKVPERNRGNFITALRGMALLGWLTETRSISGRDEMTKYRLTEQGIAAVEIAKSGLYYEVASAANLLVNLHHYFRPSQPAPSDHAVTPGSRARALASYRALIELDRAGWNLPPLEKFTDAERIKRRVVDQMRMHLEGSILSATLLALNREDRPSLFTRFESVPDTDGKVQRSLNLEHLEDDGYDREFLIAAFELMELHGLIESSEPKKQTLTLTPIGVKYEQRIGSYGVTFAYLKSYAVALELFWGNPDPYGIGEDLHLDRALDIDGSKRAHTPYIEGIHKDLRRLFDELPQDQQAAGIAVIAVGAGELAADSLKYILKETQRGKHLSTHPLDMVAVDLSEISLNEAEKTLAMALKKEPGVQVFLADESYQGGASADSPRVRVILQKGDMNQPHQIHRALRNRRFPRPNAADPHRVLGLNDLVVMLEFGPHDRGVAVNVQSVEQAREVIRKGVRLSDWTALVGVLKELGVPLEEIDDAKEDEHLLVDLVSRQFTVPFSNKGTLVPAVVGGADLTMFLEKWGTLAGGGLLALELHTPRSADMEDNVPDDPTKLMKYQRSPYAAYQWSHLLSQMMVPFLEHKLAAVLAGLELRVTQSWPSSGRSAPPPIYMTSCTSSA